jgi:hypothetical protein
LRAIVAQTRENLLPFLYYHEIHAVFSNTAHTHTHTHTQDAIEAEREAKHRQEAAALLLRRKLDLRAQKAAKKQSLEKARAAARDKAEREVRGDTWNQAQQTAFEDALLKVGAEVAMDKGERWTAIAAAVQAACPLPEGEEKTRNQCLARYSFLKRFVRDQGLCSKQ